MQKVLVKSVYDAFEYVMDHFYCFGQKELAERKDSYAVISIQDSITGGFGFQFTETSFCKGVLTLFFDDVVDDAEGAVLFTAQQAEQILDFIEAHRDADTLLVHCYAGQSRSMAVGAFAVKLLGGDNKRYFSEHAPNMHVYKTLDRTWFLRKMKKK
ncbi:MAG: hypothetical protein IJN57_08120 [Oscillospiraceae bacterium]|nr:hypothetical protein [Oscillospiraceae bacterium]